MMHSGAWIACREVHFKVAVQAMAFVKSGQEGSSQLTMSITSASGVSTHSTHEHAPRGGGGVSSHHDPNASSVS